MTARAKHESVIWHLIVMTEKNAVLNSTTIQDRDKRNEKQEVIKQIFHGSDVRLI